ncbi:hypothetical protein F5890DRAFT_1533661 [Lentinula detonsa]|uniref:Uncharacterized protein n=1 Tax=Lentinula detonsa TaxID=2804962 RepID=A0AA38PU89_9AGAR|nr:hypothetical protein F5890DRAFT_1533661 [Lentinula detonsa]
MRLILQSASGSHACFFLILGVFSAVLVDVQVVALPVSGSTTSNIPNIVSDLDSNSIGSNITLESRFDSDANVPNLHARNEPIHATIRFGPIDASGVGNEEAQWAQLGNKALIHMAKQEHDKKGEYPLTYSYQNQPKVSQAQEYHHFNVHLEGWHWDMQPGVTPNFAGLVKWDDKHVDHGVITGHITGQLQISGQVYFSADKREVTFNPK